jgi:preprotein translocase subunit SecA
MATKRAPTPTELVAKINALEGKFSRVPDGEFPGITEFYRTSLRQGKTLDELLPQAYAAVREVAKRKLSQRPFDVQVLGGIAIHQGKVTELKTGEGKTLVATMPVYLNALTGKGVHIITVNDYLARRDAEWMGPVYGTLGLTVATIVPDKSFKYTGGPVASPFPVATTGALKPCTRRQAYRADITYGVMAEFGFDYLRDNMATEMAGVVQRSEGEGGYYFALIDEVDSVLIDEARTPLIIAAQVLEDTTQFTRFAALIKRLTEDDFEVDEELHTAYFTERGQAKIEKLLNLDNLYDPENELMAFHADAALKARTLFTRDEDYIVKNDEIIIVDEFTGRLMYGRRFTEGLHQAIEAKEGVPVKAENKTLASISIQSYFKKYKKLAGMSGTAVTAKKEFQEVYNMETVEIPTHHPVKRVDHADRIFVTNEGKERALLKELTQRKLTLQPVLVGTRSVEENEHLARLLTAAHLKHTTLNAKNHEQEAGIIAQAGRSGAVTVATNMAGRGVDILLGGNPPDASDATMVKAAGGLVVIGTERHESQRVDDQLRGRSGRQGDPGESIFFVSLDDELVRVFMPDALEQLKESYADWPVDIALPEREELRTLFSEAQHRVESRNEEIRVQLLKYDTFIGHQREAIYHIRRRFLSATDLTDKIHEDTYTWLTGLSTYVKRYRVSEQETMIDFNKAMRMMRPLFVAVSDEEWLTRFQEVKTVREFGTVAQELILRLEEKIKKTKGGNELLKHRRQAYLSAIDELWMEHMTEVDTIRAGIDFTAFAGREPLDEFKREADEKFRALLAQISGKAVQNYVRSLV